MFGVGFVVGVLVDGVVGWFGVVLVVILGVVLLCGVMLCMLDGVVGVCCVVCVVGVLLVWLLVVLLFKL